MRSLKFFLVFIFLGLIELLTNWNIGALDWPVKSSQMIASFGDIYKKQLVIGIVFNHDGDSVLSVTEGEKVFIKDSQSFSSVPTGHGSLIIIEHEGGLRSVFRGVDGRLVDTTKTVYRLGESIIYDRLSFNESLVPWHFSFYDMSNHRVINPSSILPLRIDQESPIINSVFLQRVSNSDLIEAELQTKSFKQEITPGIYRLVLEVFDVLDTERISVKELEVFYDGYQIGHIYPESFSDSKGVLMMNGTKKAVSNFIDHDGNWLVEPLSIQTGLHHFSIFATDFSGNVEDKEIFFEVQGGF